MHMCVSKLTVIGSDNGLSPDRRHVEYPGREYEFAIKESDGNIFNPIFWKKFQGQKQPTLWAIA